jgi:hypothetical protein
MIPDGLEESRFEYLWVGGWPDDVESCGVLRGPDIYA